MTGSHRRWSEQRPGAPTAANTVIHEVQYIIERAAPTMLSSVPETRVERDDVCVQTWYSVCIDGDHRMFPVQQKKVFRLQMLVIKVVFTTHPICSVVNFNILIGSCAMRL